MGYNHDVLTTFHPSHLHKTALIFSIFTFFMRNVQILLYPGVYMALQSLVNGFKTDYKGCNIHLDGRHDDCTTLY